MDDDWGYPLFSEQAMKKVFGNHKKNRFGRLNQPALGKPSDV